MGGGRLWWLLGGGPALSNLLIACTGPSAVLTALPAKLTAGRPYDWNINVTRPEALLRVDAKPRSPIAALFANMVPDFGATSVRTPCYASGSRPPERGMCNTAMESGGSPPATYWLAPKRVSSPMHRPLSCLRRSG